MNATTMMQDPPDSFPKEFVEKVTVENKETPKVRVCKLSFENLKRAATLTHNNFIENKWDKKTSMAYLNQYCFNTNAKQCILDCANNCATKIIATRQQNHEVLANIAVLEQKSPSDFQPWQPPAYYDCGILLDQFLEPMMHLFFHGLCKATVMQAKIGQHSIIATLLYEK